MRSQGTKMFLLFQFNRKKKHKKIKQKKEMRWRMNGWETVCGYNSKQKR